MTTRTRPMRVNHGLEAGVYAVDEVIIRPRAEGYICEISVQGYVFSSPVMSLEDAKTHARETRGEGALIQT